MLDAYPRRMAPQLSDALAAATLNETERYVAGAAEFLAGVEWMLDAR